MKKKMRMKDRSTISPLECLALHAYLICILFIDYKILAFTSLVDCSVSKSKWILILCMVIASIFGTAIRWRKNMSIRGVFADVMTGLGVYTVLAYREYYSGWMKVLFAIFLAFFIVYIGFTFSKKSKNRCLHGMSERRKRLVIKSRIFGSLNIAGLVLGVFMTALLVPIMYNRVFYGGIMVADSKYTETEGFDIDYTQNELGLTYNYDSISKIRYKSSWEPLTTEEKLTVLQDICNCESNYWGMERLVTVVMGNLDDNTLGSYLDSERTIIIDKQHLENDNPEEVLNTILHEMYHAWEHDLVRLYLDSSSSQRKMRVFEHCEEYVNEMADYQDGGDDYESFMKYYCQHLETDSRNYAKKTTVEYYNEIDLIAAERSKKDSDVNNLKIQ